MKYVDPVPTEKFPSVDAVHLALSQSGGSFECAALALGVEIRTLYRMGMDYPDIYDSAYYYRKIYIDMMVCRAERKLMEKVQEGDFKAVQFALRNQGKVLGWNTDAEPIQIQPTAVHTITYADAAQLVDRREQAKNDSD